jgi:hypothetical protein
MPKHIIKLKDYYLEWSTIVDAPVTFGMSLDELNKYYQAEYGQSSLLPFAQKLKDTEEYGSSDRNGIDSVISCNRAGPNEIPLSKARIYKVFCLRQPLKVNGYFLTEAGSWKKSVDQKIEEQYIPFNLNCCVRVRLTDMGRSYLEAQHNRILGALATKCPYTPVEEIDGWATFQLWDLMGKFGEFCQTLGLSDMPFAMDIEFASERIPQQKSWESPCSTK